MNSEWQKILTAQGLKSEGDDFIYPGNVTDEAVICPLASEVVLQVTGDDAESFLQAQFSNDLAELESPGSQLTTWSSPKGRVITVLRVVKNTDGYLLRLPADLLEPVLKRLRMYVLMAKVTIEPREDILVAGVSGDKAVAALTDMAATLPKATDDTSELTSGGWMTRVRGDAGNAVNRFEIVADASQMTQLWEKLVQVSEINAETTWRLQNIDAGVPAVNTATTEAFVLQMLNLQHINGVNFKKGCFPGQEVVARMQYLGKLKRQMYRLQHTGGATPVAGDEIYIAERASAVGKVVDAVSADESTCRMLAVMAIAETSEPLFLDKNGRQPLELINLPYETPLAD